MLIRGLRLIYVSCCDFTNFCKIRHLAPWERQEKSSQFLSSERDLNHFAFTAFLLQMRLYTRVKVFQIFFTFFSSINTFSNDICIPIKTTALLLQHITFLSYICNTVPLHFSMLDQNVQTE